MMPKEKDRPLEWKEFRDRLREILEEEVKLSDESVFRRYADAAIDSRVALFTCAEKFGTPLYVLDEDMLKKRALRFISAFKGHIPKMRFFYAFKSNDLPHLISILKSEGFEADVASGLELELALNLGFRNIIYTAPVKSEAELGLALKHRDRVVINIDNLDELLDVARLNELQAVGSGKRTQKTRISFRIRHEWKKFGLELDELAEAAGMAKEKGLAWAGVHFHASWNKGPKAYVDDIKKIAGFLKRNFSKEELAGLRFLDIGGGFLAEGSGTLFSATKKGGLLEIADKRDSRLGMIKPEKIEEIEAFAQKIGAAVKRHCTGPLKDIEIWAEPGRYISSLATYILLRVVSVRKQGIFVDGGINLIGSSAFDLEYFPVVNITRPSGSIQRARIFGPLCDPDDHFGSAYFGERCRKGDFLAVMHQGAYTFSTAWRWQQPTAAYAAFSGNSIRLVKARETFSDRYRGTKTPYL